MFATSDAAELPEFDVGIFACKALDLDQSAGRLSGLVRDAAMMTVQNGLGAEAVVARHGAWPIISAVTFMSGIRHDDAHVEYELDTATWMGPWAQTATPYPLVEELAALMRSAGLEAEPMPDLLPGAVVEADLQFGDQHRRRVDGAAACGALRARGDSATWDGSCTA